MCQIVSFCCVLLCFFNGLIEGLRFCCVFVLVFILHFNFLASYQLALLFFFRKKKSNKRKGADIQNSLYVGCYRDLTTVLLCCRAEHRFCIVLCQIVSFCIVLCQVAWGVVYFSRVSYLPRMAFLRQ